MIAFASLLLGLIVGPQPVELLAGDAVAAVELRLDGRRLAVLSGEPWTLECDFGAELKPHELVAIAYDAEDHELSRARLSVNLPRRPAEAAIVLDGDGGGRGVAAVLRWESVVGGEPAASLWLDGRPVPVDDPRRVPLPDHDPGELHLLRAELDFDHNVSTVLELVFGGDYAGQASVELTALPLMVEGDAEPTVEGLWGRLRKRGRPLVVAAVEEGPAEVLLVRDEGVRRRLNRLGRTSLKALRRRARLGRAAAAVSRERQRFAMTLDGDPQIRFLWPFPRRRGAEFELLSPSRPFTAEDGGLYWLLTEVPVPATVASDEDQQLADAVAVAGLLAAGRGRRRAVVLVTGGGGEDHSRFRPRDVRRYLAELEVPLVVWSVAAAPGEGSAWGEVIEVSSLRQLERAVDDLGRLLDRQRIVWLEGVHVPGEIVLEARPAPGIAPPPAAPRRQSGGPPEIVAAAGGDLVRAAAGTRLRRRPDAGSPAIAIVDAAVELPVRERSGAWLRVPYAGLLGWIGDPAAAAPAPAVHPPRIARARELLGLDPAEPAAAALGPFELHTDVADRELLRSLGQIAAALPEAFRRRYGVDPGAGTGTVVLFAREADYRAFAAAVGAEPGGGTLGHADRGASVLFAGRQRREEVAAVLVHELAHLLSRRALAAPPPPWLDEGIANDLSFCRVDGAGQLQLGSLGGRSVVVEEPAYRPGGWLGVDRAVHLEGPVASLRLLREAVKGGTVPTLATLAALSPGGFFEPEGRQLRYDASAFFVRYLLAGGGLDRGFRAFLAAAAGGAAADSEALLGHLRRGWGELQRGFETWLDYPDGQP